MGIIHATPKIIFDKLSFSVDAYNSKSLDGNENLLTYSQQLDNSEWNKTGFQGLATVTTNSIVAPDGTQTAETLHFAPDPDQSRRSWFAPISLDGTYTVSAHVKKGDMSEIALYVSANVNPYPGVKYDFDTDTVTPIGQATNPPVGIPTTVAVERTLLSDGWVRISGTAYAKATLPYRNETAFIGLTTGYTYAWGVQLEKRSSSSTYYETTDTSKVASTYLTDSVSGGIGTFVSGAPAYNSDDGNSIVFTGLSTVGLASNTHVDFPDDASLRLSNTFSISSWFYWNGINQYTALFSKRNGSNPYNQWGFGIFNNPYGGGISNNLHFFGRRDDHGGSTEDIVLKYPLPEAGWYNVAVSVSPSQQALYVNGIGRDTSAKDIIGAEYNIPGKDFYLGHGTESPNAKFDGKISSVQIYKDKVLSQEEIIHNYDIYRTRYGLGSVPLHLTWDGFILYLDAADTSSYAGNVGVGSTAWIDLSGNGNGTLFNGTYHTDGPFVDAGYVEFDGTGDYISVASTTDLSFRTNDYTIEFWVKFDTLTDKKLFFGGPNNTIQFYHTESLFFGAPANSLIVSNKLVNQHTVSWDPIAYRWYHLAVSRSSGDIRIFVDGSQVGITTTGDTTDYTGENNLIGGDSGLSWYVDGSISNFRAVKGTALYTSNFTPPKTALTAVSNTVLLTCQGNIIADASGIGHTITANGDISLTKEPFFGAGAVEFDGTDDYLSFGSSTDFAFGTGDFTIEAWVKRNGVQPVNATIVCIAALFANTNWQLDFTIDQELRFFTGDDSDISSGVIPDDTWVHVAATRSGTTVRLFVDGVEVGSRTSSDDLSDDDGIRIGLNRNSTTYFKGQISNVRLIKGTALYTSNFTPPTTSLEPIENTTLLTCQGQNIKDASSSAHAITVNGGAEVTIIDSSFEFDGIDDYVSVAGITTVSSATFIAWVYRTGTISWPGIIFNANGATGMSLGYSDNRVAYVWNNAGNTFTWNSGLIVPENEWCMIAASVNPSSATAYLYQSSGVSSATNTVSHSPATLDALQIGRDANVSTRIFDGKISVAQVYDRALTQAEITQNYEITKGRYELPQYNIVTSGLSLYLDAGNTASYPGSGDTWTDLSGQGNNGTLTNGPTFDSANGGSIVFDGIDDEVNIAYTLNLAFTNSILSCEAWVYIDTLGSKQFSIINKRGNNATQNNNRPYVFEVDDDGTIRWILDDASTICDTATGLIQTGQWYHLAATHDGDNAKIYVNGVLNTTQSSGTSSFNNTGNIPTRIGYRYRNGDVNYSDGRIAELRVYSKALSVVEVSQNYEATKGRYGY